MRARHTLTNAGRLPYAVAALEVVFPLPAAAAEILDFSGRHLFERTPQRHPVTDGLWLREGRRGHTGHDAATLLIAGTPGFGFGHGEVYGVHVAWSGNTVHYVERLASRTATIGGGELLLPGEICLAGGESYTTPWVYLAARRRAGRAGRPVPRLPALAARAPAHAPAGHPERVGGGLLRPRPGPADRAGGPGRRGRRGAVRAGRRLVRRPPRRPRRARRLAGGRAGLAGRAAPAGRPRPRARGMEFGLWFEPEMVNPDSELYRAHPDWILSAGGPHPAAGAATSSSWT